MVMDCQLRSSLHCCRHWGLHWQTLFRRELKRSIISHWLCSCLRLLMAIWMTCVEQVCRATIVDIAASKPLNQLPRKDTA